LHRDNSPQGGWNFEGKLSSAWVRRPDNLIRLRIGMGNTSARISSVRVVQD
jgi:hypothetical protein